jgi:hypothetical protein
VSALRDLESPIDRDVLDLAATLGTPLQSQTQTQTPSQSQSRSRSQPQPPPPPQPQPPSHPALQPQYQYGERVPSRNALYDWSPMPQTPQQDTLRSTALLHTIRNHPRFSARTREYLHRYAQDRERDRRQDVLSRVDAYRQSYLDHDRTRERDRDRDRDPPPPPPPISPMLEQAVQYLARIRNHNADPEDVPLRESPSSLGSPDDDLITDARTLPPIQRSSWLSPGAVLQGCQHATTAHQLEPPTRPWLAHAYTSNTPRSRPAAHSTATHSPDLSTSTPQDRWPVKVTVHAVDWANMSLAATMEAYNVPSHSHSHASLPPDQHVTRTSSITTYLEGEILDFSTHTLLTESFKSNAANDATYWRKLPPFTDMSDADVVRALTSRRWFSQVFARDWILMRWKERCFVKSLQCTPPSPPTTATATATATTTDYARPTLPTAETDAQHAAFDDSGCGLTISGFYYVCLRRADGRLEGLYYDPQSSPYQCLKLDSVRRASFPSWGFR